MDHASRPPQAFVIAVMALAFAFARVTYAEEQWPGSSWTTATPIEIGMDAGKLESARDYALQGGGSGYIVRGGRLVMSWGSATQLYAVKAATQSIGVTALGLAIADGRMALGDEGRQHHPSFGIPPSSNGATGWLDDITLTHLATHTAGFDDGGGYAALVFAPGTRWASSDGGANWLAECITLAFHEDLLTLMTRRVFGPIGIPSDELTWRVNAHRPATIDGVVNREFGAGIQTSVDAMARIGYLYLRRGRWNDQQILPRAFVDAASTTVPGVPGLPVLDPATHFDASNHHGLLWWNNADGTLAGVPRDAFWSWGLGETWIIVIPSLDIVATRAGGKLQPSWSANYGVIQPFIEPIAASVNRGAPYPPSRHITSLAWAPPWTIERQAHGSDTFPITWADDGNLYTAFADGHGFAPGAPRNLSLGPAKITGPATSPIGVNIPSPSGEQHGEGPTGKKASGMLMVDGTLYMWVRNANLDGTGSQLAWSSDHGRSWTWSNWKFAEFGYPTFLNFRKDYARARDGYVYAYSHDDPSAYAPSDRFVLFRVPKNRITNRSSYEFFKGLDANGAPLWTTGIAQRGAVFTHPGHCRRSGIGYDAALGRYLWWQMYHENGVDHRFEGGFGIYDAPTPWGPWTTVYFTRSWDVGPGETASFPTKWMSADGKTLHLVFSGDDAFSVRGASLSSETLTPPAVPGRHGTGLRVGKLDSSGSGLSVVWDTTSCMGADGHHIVFGFGSQLPSGPAGVYSLGGSECSVTSPFQWVHSPNPSSDPTGLLWFLVIANDGSTTEGSWGNDSNNHERSGPAVGGASGQCGFGTKSLANGCGR